MGRRPHEDYARHLALTVLHGFVIWSLGVRIAIDNSPLSLASDQHSYLAGKAIARR